MTSTPLMKTACSRCGLSYNECKCYEESRSPAGYVAVPESELAKLEEAREKLWVVLDVHIKDMRVRSHLLEITSQVWRVANTKKWDAT